MVDKIEDEVEVVLDCGYFTFDKGAEEVNRVSIYTGTFVLGGVKDSFADVAREGVGLMWMWAGWRWVITRWNGLRVQFVNMGDIGRVNSSKRLGRACK